MDKINLLGVFVVYIGTVLVLVGVEGLCTGYSRSPFLIKLLLFFERFVRYNWRI